MKGFWIVQPFLRFRLFRQPLIADGNNIFNFQKEEIQKLTIKTQKENLEFERTNRECEK
jgi:hypothetical protein